VKKVKGEDLLPSVMTWLGSNDSSLSCSPTQAYKVLTFRLASSPPLASGTKKEAIHLQSLLGGNRRKLSDKTFRSPYLSAFETMTSSTKTMTKSPYQDRSWLPPPLPWLERPQRLRRPRLRWLRLTLLFVNLGSSWRSGTRWIPQPRNCLRASLA
jgi:hypothetical protein